MCPCVRSKIVAHRNTSAISVREVSDYPNVIVLQTEIPEARWGDGEWVDKERLRLVQSVLAGPLGRKFRDPVQWFYDPMAVTAFAVEQVVISRKTLGRRSSMACRASRRVKRVVACGSAAGKSFDGGSLPPLE